MTKREFLEQLTDIDYRRDLLARIQVDNLSVDEEVWVLKTALGTPHRKWANTRRTEPTATVLLALVTEHRAHPFPVPATVHFVSQEMRDAYAIRTEAQRRLTDPVYRDQRPQLREVIDSLDERYSGALIGVDVGSE
jgi:hypothetical protein